MFTERTRLLARIALLLVAGFLAVSLGAYWVSRDTLRHNLAAEGLPLTGDNIYSEIQKDILRPVFISSLMANDTFVRDWLLSGEKDTAQIARYLREIKEKYGTLTSFLVSDLSANYYYVDGVLKRVRPDEPRDAWFYRVREMQPAYELNVDPDAANRDIKTIFINYRVFDYDGRFIGATGVGLPLALVAQQIESYETRFRRRIYFLDAAGRVVLASGRTPPAAASIRETPGIRDVAERILQRHGSPQQLEYAHDGATVLVNARHIPELDWHLVVEQNDADAVRPVRQVLLVNLAISALVTLLVLTTALIAINRYQHRLEKAAATDPLTGALNRLAFDVVFQVALRDCQRNGQALSAILIDLDLFKQINDSRGHLAGDQVLRAAAELIRSQLREADVMARWGGEEFLVLLRDCPLENALNVAEKLRVTVAAHDFAAGGETQPLTISLGVAEHAAGDSAEALFHRADRALYQAKRNGRNRVETTPA
ncbi:sensor domain-containing diguanylate cyclase [Azospira restricta]|uniref:diguanylate cyclase n=1 Tax=Azospira restricta TaxID=404405 RepID=A0A974PWR9_9RHOO|nr:sensor domain-containing diguanylate cyclase [Azospira restricta]QRJ62644.1 GGDEF domain-containing protein [Azospira restricta]